MIIKDLLPNSLKSEIYNLLTCDHFPWFYNENATNYQNNVSNENTFQFVHIFYGSGRINSDKYQLIQTIMWFFEKETGIKIKAIDRVKANLTTRYNMTTKDKLDAVHKDHDDKNFLSLVYYVNDSDGDTIFYDENGNIEHNVTPQANSLVYFKSNISHAGMFPRLNKRKIVINFVVEVE
jgi:Rps23 Pro-64 3,4-dihydroxylase Tpa1-like proline 4-hydroxylase